MRPCSFRVAGSIIGEQLIDPRLNLITDALHTVGPVAGIGLPHPGDRSLSKGDASTLKIERYDRDPTAYTDAIVVDTFKAKKAYSPDSLRSGGLGICIAIGVYDPQTSSGHMIHHFAFSNYFGELALFIHRLLQNYGDLSRLHVVAVGGARQTVGRYDEGLGEINDIDLNPQVLGSRSVVEDTIITYFANAEVYIEWTPLDGCRELYLETESGTFSIVSHR